MLTKSVWVLRSKSHVNTRLQLKDEKAHAYRLIPWLALVNISFGFVDWLVAPQGNVWVYFGVRILAVVLSRFLYLWSRGRCRYGMRLFVTVAPYMWGVEYIMLTQKLLIGPYFAGLALVMVTSTMLFPVRAKIAAMVYFITILPVLAWVSLTGDYGGIDSLNIFLMSLGCVYVCAVNSGQVHDDLREKFKVAETLARDLGKRDKEIREKANELVKRQIFESQFSPQVVSAVLRDRSLVIDMKRMLIATVVIDIENSTKKANSIPPDSYKEVVEEVLDVFSAACLKWNVTLDKFTGDGVQAFSGAPVKKSDDLFRAISACDETIRMLSARKPLLGRLWQEEVNVRFAVCYGEALVGFIGKGIFKSYTAVGDTVSFTHRLSSVGKPWTIVVHNWHTRSVEDINFPEFDREDMSITGLKGFEEKKFSVVQFRQKQESTTLDAGRCDECGTPLVMEETITGIPRVYCSACSSQSIRKAA